MAEKPAALRTPAQYGHLVKISDGDEVIEICLWNILLTLCIQNYVLTVFTWCSKQTLSTNTYSECCERCSFCLVSILLVGVLLGILGGGVPPGSSNPDPLSDQKVSFFTPVFRPGLKELTRTDVIIHRSERAKRFLKLQFEFAYFSFFLIHLELKR